MSLKPNRPEPFTGKRDHLTVETFLHTVVNYISLVQVINPAVLVGEEQVVAFASTLLQGSAANWWYIVCQTNDKPNTFQEFANALRAEFIPQDHIRRARNYLSRLRQISSVSVYLSEFRNATIPITGITDDEKLDRFLFGLKPDIRVEVLKADPKSFDDAAHKALCIDSAMYSVPKFQSYSASRFQAPSSFKSFSTPTPMEIGNIGSKGVGSSISNKFQQRKEDIKNNACFTCHKPGCRPYKHKVHKSGNWRKGEFHQIQGSTRSQDNRNDGNSGKSMFHLN